MLELAGSFRTLGPVSWLPLLALLFAVRALLAGGLDQLGAYDEGVLFTDAFLLRSGYVLYRDFHFCYPPGVVQIVRAVMALGLPAIWTVRLLGLGVRMGSGVLAGVAVGRAHGSRFCIWTCAAVIVLQEHLGLVFFAYPLAVLLVFAAVLSWPQANAPRWRAITAGILLATVSYVRLDVFVYGASGLAGVEAVWWLARRESFLMESKGRLRDFFVALVATLSVLWLPVLVSSGPRRVLQDLVIDLATRIMPRRTLPVPPLLEMWRISPLDIRLPAGLVDTKRLGLVFAFAGAGSAMVATLVRGMRALRQREPYAELAGLRTLVMILAFTFGTLPQALHRFDYPHVVYGVPLTLVALFLAVGPRLREPVLILSMLTWFHKAPPLIDWDGAKRLWEKRGDEAFVPEPRMAVVRYIQSKTRPGEPFFSACYSHRRTMQSRVELHYLARRPGATQYMLFDPGTTDSEEGQREMIADLKRTRPKLVLRSAGCVWNEPNDSRIEGSTLLDEFLAKNYEFHEKVGSFAAWLPRTSS